MSLTDHIDTLRSGSQRLPDEAVMQLVYEKWLKLDTWKARSEALPLAVGVAPERWQDHIREYDLAKAEQELWATFAASNGIGGDDVPVSVTTVYDWFTANGVELPAGFSRLYGFIRQAVLVAGAAQASNDESTSAAPPEEREIVLGAALSLVSRMPRQCRDEHGFVDGAAITELIFETAARWFPNSTPSMTRAQITELIDKWLE